MIRRAQRATRGHRLPVLVAILAGALVLAHRIGRETPRSVVRPALTETTTPEAPRAVAAPPSSAAPSTSERGARARVAPSVGIDDVERLRIELAGDDDAAKIEAVEAAAQDGVAGALPVLASIDLAREPEAAPTIIRALASLAKRGTRRDRDTAASTLGQWLDEETRRRDLDAIGNVPNIVEALGETGGDAAVDALTTALDTGRLELPVETLVVQQLAAIGEARARPAVSRFAVRVEAMPEGEDIDRELRNEARQAAEAALARLAH